MGNIGHIILARLFQPFRFGDVMEQGDRARADVAFHQRRGDHAQPAAVNLLRFFHRLAVFTDGLHIFGQARDELHGGFIVRFAVAAEHLNQRRVDMRYFAVCIQRQQAFGNAVDQLLQPVAFQGEHVDGFAQAFGQIVERMRQFPDLARHGFVRADGKVPVGHAHGDIAHLQNGFADFAHGEIQRDAQHDVYGQQAEHQHPRNTGYQHGKKQADR